MKLNPTSLIKLRSFFIASQKFPCSNKNPIFNLPVFFTTGTPPNCLTICPNQIETVLEEDLEPPQKDSVFFTTGTPANSSTIIPNQIETFLEEDLEPPQKGSIFFTTGTPTNCSTIIPNQIENVLEEVLEPPQKESLFLTTGTPANCSTKSPNQIVTVLEGDLEPPQRESVFFTTGTPTNCSTKSPNQIGTVFEENLEPPPKDSVEVLKRWGCNDNDLLKILSRGPALRNADVIFLQSKLTLLQGLGITSTDLVKIINCRPRFLSSRINHCFDERLEYFMTLFGSKEVLIKAIVRNPSLLTYDFHNSIKPAIAMYEQMGVHKHDLVPMLLSRPTLIPRTSFNDEKLEYITKTGIQKDSKLYKYIVCIIGISRIETIREKVANFEKFGFLEDEIWGLIGRCPVLLTLSVDKVQRNMTFVVATMRVPANVVLKYPNLVLSNLEVVLKPRMHLAGKLQGMNLSPQVKGPLMFRALRMTEKRFLKFFVWCHSEDVAEELMEFYEKAKGCKRLAENSKRTVHKGFPF
ncbi:transcription termination factor MTERF9, chloroplastic-like [Euphorbia lathyris]|uniref:transcription termination factor MTERF9, chloroplastic-like n=1 Tax=Euphorbia lathyris TaxID=212925 RepID=UPI003313E83A